MCPGIKEIGFILFGSRHPDERFTGWKPGTGGTPPFSNIILVFDHTPSQLLPENILLV